MFRLPGIGLPETLPTPPSVMGIAPLGALIFEREEITPRTTAVLDTLGYTYITVFIEVNRAASIILESVSMDGTRWRPVEENIKSFDSADRAFVNLNEVITTKQVLMYRFLKIRVEAEVPVVITLEVASKLIDMGALQDIRDAFMIDKKAFKERVETFRRLLKEEIATYSKVFEKYETTVKEHIETFDKVFEKYETTYKERIETIAKLGILDINWEPVSSTFEKIDDIYGILTNPDTWTHDQKNVTSPGTPVQLAALPVPDGYALVVRAKSSNTGNIYQGNSKDTTADSAKRVTLAANDSTKLYVKKASEVWIDADTAGEGVEYWCEKRK